MNLKILKYKLFIMCCHQPAPDVSSEEEHAFDEAAYEDSETETEEEGATER